MRLDLTFIYSSPTPTSSPNPPPFIKADYYRDPLHIPAYLRHNTFLPYLNHEANNQTNRLYPYGLDSLEALVLVKALQDREVRSADRGVLHVPQSLTYTNTHDHTPYIYNRSGPANRSG